MRMLDLFSGIGGFSLAAEWCWGRELEIVCHVEIDKQCQGRLKKHWPDVPIHSDIKDFRYDGPIELICGGDPCPVRSKAKSLWKTKSPDLSGYFLAVVGRSKPWWVVRENVPSSDDIDFTTALEMLGYRTIIVSTNSAKITAQNRERDFIVGCNNENRFKRFLAVLPKHKINKRYAETKYEKTPAYPCLTTHPSRWDSRDGYIWTGNKLRVASVEERLKLTGFPSNWLDGLPKSTAARMLGNAIVPQVAYIIMQKIKEVIDGISR